MAANPSMDTGDTDALRAIPQHIVEAWADHDADRFAEVFTDNATLILPGDVFLTSREEIRTFMRNAFSGPFKGTRVTGEPRSIRPLAGSVAVLVTQGGVLAPGDTVPTDARAIRATWVLVKEGADWRIASYQNTPIAAA
ncbi:SgcJ/EcaC family oxidoreductase [Streptomyces sp. NPDC058659]|uniref:SgcJ/EcaC family oxidoreductase n=1 Tax=unclassified Streptomyces TaxID=2593676 RepID=UPI0036467801